MFIAQSNHWVGTVLLTTCQVIERPSKKDGFCFKLFHPLEQSIWAPRGPEKEAIGKKNITIYLTFMNYVFMNLNFTCIRGILREVRIFIPVWKKVLLEKNFFFCFFSNSDEYNNIFRQYSIILLFIIYSIRLHFYCIYHIRGSFNK